MIDSAGGCSLEPPMPICHNYSGFVCQYRPGDRIREPFFFIIRRFILSTKKIASAKHAATGSLSLRSSWHSPPRPMAGVRQQKYANDWLGLLAWKKPNVDMGVSKNMGTPPKSSILIGFGSIINHPFWGFSPYFWKHPHVPVHQTIQTKPSRYAVVFHGR